MKYIKSKWFGLFGILAGAAIVLGVALPASADVPESDGTLHLCYQTNIPTNGTNLKLIDPDHSGICGSGTSEVTINQTGPQGPAGATGATGPQGPAGTSFDVFKLQMTTDSSSNYSCTLNAAAGPDASSLSVVVNGSSCEVKGFPTSHMMIFVQPYGHSSLGGLASADSGDFPYSYGSDSTGFASPPYFYGPGAGAGSSGIAVFTYQQGTTTTPPNVGWAGNAGVFSVMVVPDPAN